MRVRVKLWLATWLVLAIGAPSLAADESFESAAKTLSAATVTVRMQSPGDGRSAKADVDGRSAKADVDGKLAAEAKSPRVDKAEDNNGNDAGAAVAEDERANRQRFAIASGVCVGENLIVTALRPQKDSEFRVTLAGGQRAAAKLCVVDAHTSLALLEARIERDSKPAVSRLEIAAEPARLGTRLVAASAWGSEAPTVSVGVLGGVDRFIPSSLLPPLLQCDVHTTETSRGAGVVNAAGELVGIVVAVDGDGRRSNWTYLVGAEHVARLVAARKAGDLVELPRRVAHAGLDLRQIAGSESLMVKGIVAGGPADKAGIRVGDELRSLDGRAIHSAFAAARAIASRQPGDTVACVVRRGEGELTLALTLEQSSAEPAISYKEKGATGGARNGTDVAEKKANSAEKRGTADGPGRLPDLSTVVPPDVKPAALPKGGANDRVDALDDLRARLRHQQDLIERLEAELADLRRERDRLVRNPAPSPAPSPARPETPPAPAPR